MISVSLVACNAGGPAPSATPPVDIATRVHDFAAALREDAPYRPPGRAQRRAFTEALAGLGPDPGGADDELRSLGFTVERGVDERTGRPYAVVASEPNAERGWGLYAVDLSRPARVAVQVPHPANDLRTDEVGVDLFRRVPGAVLVVAGTHRRVANGAGDVAHRVDSMFHAVAERHSRDRVPQVQLHGFDDDSLPSFDLVLSPGAAGQDALLEEVADGLDGRLRVCRAWARDCGDLEGRRNRQGGVAAEHGAFFAHVEINRAVRDSPEEREEVVRVLAEALEDG